MNPKLKKIIGIVCCVLCIGSMFLFGASAAATNEVVTMAPEAAIDAAENLFGQITQTLNFSNVAAVLAIGIGAAVGIWLAWWGLRKLVRIITRVLERGKLSL